MRITPRIFGAYLKCPMKCWLRAAGEHPSGNIYTEWRQRQDESYRVAEAQTLLVQMPSEEVVLSPCSSRGGEPHCSTEYLKAAKWRLAIDVPLITEENQQTRGRRHRESYSSFEAGKQSIVPKAAAKQEADQQQVGIIESCLHAIERIPSAGRSKPTNFIPIRFAFQNKLDNDERMLLAFDAAALSGVLGRLIPFGKIIHGDRHTTIKVKTSTMANQVRACIVKIGALLSGQSPPDLSLNRHCTECEFQDRCRKVATEKDDLSLLSSMSEKERRKLRTKGVFSINQLSYTFRPRRRAKSHNERKEKYHHSLKALSIRESKIHVVGSPELKIDGTPVYLDVEGIPDREFYYLIGVRIRNRDSFSQQSLWAEELSDEIVIWNDFLSILARITNPVIIHYGSYETTFISRMCSRYGIPSAFTSLVEVVARSINLVSVIYANIYYPTYSNSLKDIAKFLDFRWSNTDASGLTSIVWRRQWEETHSNELLQKLMTYNAEDCEALERVTDSVRELCEMKVYTSTVDDSVFVNVDSLKREKIYPFKTNEFIFPALEQINKAAYWDYQRNRIYLRTDRKVRAAVLNSAREKRRSHPTKINQTIELQDRPSTCPKCGHHTLDRLLWNTKIVHDLKFSESGIRRWIVKYRFPSYRCRSCHSSTSLRDKPWVRSKYGPNLRSYILYQMIELRVSQASIARSLNQLFGMRVPITTSNCQKALGSKIYEPTYKRIVNEIASGAFIHADETRVSVDRRDAYVWVFANHNSVAYKYVDSREGGMIHEFLRDFKGVLISDFYAAYDSIECPQQKCLAHLIRDLNEEILKQPFNGELKWMAREFSDMLKSIVDTIDKFGLKARFMRKHKAQVNRFYHELMIRPFKTEVGIKYKKRFEKDSGKLFTFLDYDNVSWNNNNAEHAIKAFAMLRNLIGGTGTENSIQDYLILLSIEETCKCRGINFLDFLRSGELDIDKFSTSIRLRRKARWAPLSPRRKV